MPPVGDRLPALLVSDHRVRSGSTKSVSIGVILLSWLFFIGGKNGVCGVVIVVSRMPDRWYLAFFGLCGQAHVEKGVFLCLVLEHDSA